MKKFMKGILVALCAVVGLSAGAAASTLSAPVDVETAYAEATTYTTKDVAMMGRIEGWYGNGNFTMNITLGESDWGSETGAKTYAGEGDMNAVLRGMDFFNHIKVGEKTIS